MRAFNDKLFGAGTPTTAEMTAAVGTDTPIPVAQGGTGAATLADGGLVVGNATGVVEVVAAGATTELLVGGGASTKPVWTTATGSGAPVRATSPILVTPILGVASGTSLKLSGLNITAASGTGITVDDVGSLNRQVYKVTTTYAAFATAGVNNDKTIATLPAKTRIVSVICDVTTEFTGGAISNYTLRLGNGGGGEQYLLIFSAFTTKVVGLADSALGASLARATAVSGGAVPNWTGTQALVVRSTSTSANLDAATQGSATWYILTEKY